MNTNTVALLAVCLCVFPACSRGKAGGKTGVAPPSGISGRTRKAHRVLRASLVRKGTAKGGRCGQVGPAFPRYERVGCRGGVRWPDETPKKGGSLLWPPPRGCLDKSIIRKVFERQRPELACCLEPIRKRRRVIIDLKIDCDGHVSEAGVGSDLPLDPVRETCLTTVLKTWRFAPPRGFIQVRYPLDVVPAP